MNENIKIGSSFNSFIFIYADLDSSRKPSPPHYSRGGGRATFVLPESAPSRELETSSYYEEEQILCWCVRCRGTYRRPWRQCRSHESEYGVFVDAPAPSQRHRPMEYATSLDDKDGIYSHDAHQSCTWHGQAIQLLQIDILRQSLPPGLESEMSHDYVLLDRLQPLVHTYDPRHYGGWEGGSLPRDGEVFSFWGARYMIAPSSIPDGGCGLFIAQDLQVPPNSEVPAYDMENDVRLPSHGTSCMPNEYMRLLRKSDPKSYDKLKKQYEMDFDQAHGNYNEDNDMDGNDMDEFINDWYGEDDAGEDESFLRAEALQRIYEGSKLSRLNFLPLVIDGCLTTGICDVIYHLGKLARWITSKGIDIASIAQKKKECIELLCLMEKELPTSFFDIQVHLLIHLVDEIEIAELLALIGCSG
ncbi:hypothetical protein L7F22_055905 [Adiantum nelumboides]|nr:hypothetical protein [Adiantum nelumboides]